MAVNSLIIVEAILFAVLLTAISIGIKDKSISKNDEGLNRFLVFAYAYMIGIICYIIIFFLCYKETIAIYVFNLIIWYAYCAVLASMIIQSMFIFGNESARIRRITEILCYYSLLVVIIELFFNRFIFEYDITGVEFTPEVVPMVVWYSFPIIVYYAVMGYLLWNYHKTHTKIREKHLMKLALYAIVPSFIGLIAESICHTVFHIRYPVFFVLMIISFKLMSDIHIKNRSFMLKPEDFDAILKADNTDAVFICDDEQTIIYQNKAALINSQMYRDTFIGRKLTDVFVLDSDVRRAMKSKEARDGLMVPAIYPLTERKLVMSVEYIYDCVDEILCSIITIPNYEISVDDRNFNIGENLYKDTDNSTVKKIPSVMERDDDTVPGKENLLIDNDVNVLIVDENADELEAFESMLKPYEIKVSRALGGRMAMEMLLDPCYDAIFIAYDMLKLSGVETAKRIRSMGDSYYSEVPLIFILSEPVSNVYKDLLDVSFNDFLEKPLSSGKLSSIMTRWLWRRYAITDRSGAGIISTRAIRSMDELEVMYKDCLEFYGSDKMQYIGYTLKGMKRLCSKLEDKELIAACDNMIDIYIRGQYALMDEMMSAFHTELERVRNSANFLVF